MHKGKTNPNLTFSIAIYRQDFRGIPDNSIDLTAP